MEQQIKDTYYKVYADLLEEDLNNDNFEWVCKLHSEIIVRLCTIIPNRKDIHNQIIGQMDPVIFKQTLQHGCFKGDEFIEMVNCVFEWIKRLCSPARDKDVDASLSKIWDAMKDGATMGKLVPLFVFSVHAHIDTILEDMGSETAQNFKQFLQKELKK